MARQDKGTTCRCGCGERKPRNKKYVAGHSATNRLINIGREVRIDFARHSRAKRQHGLLEKLLAA